MLTGVLLPLTYTVKGGVTGNLSPFFHGAVMGKGFITPWRPPRPLGNKQKSQPQAEDQDLLGWGIVSEVKASCCPMSYIGGPWKTSQALRT